jgi:tetratricopeptide (TPR) repeat protein
MNSPHAATPGDRLNGSLISLLLFPLDLVRLTFLFFIMTARVTVRPFEAWLTRRSNSGSALHHCGAIRVSSKETPATCFVAQRTLTSGWLRLYCGCGKRRNPTGSSGAPSAGMFRLTATRYLRMLLFLSLTWGSLAWAAHALWRSTFPHGANGDVVAKFNREAAALYANGAFSRARIQYLNAVQKRPSDLTAQWGVALCALKLDLPREAREALLKVLALDASSLKAHTLLADLLLGQGVPDEALAHAAWVVKMNPKDANALVRMGECRRLQGHPTEARQQAEAALKQAPNHGKALLLAARAAADAGEFAAAREYLDRILGSQPEDKLDRFNMARVYSKCGDHAAARAQLEKILSAHPDSIPAARELAEVLFAAGDMGGAIEKYKALERTVPNDPTIRIRLAVLLLTTGRLDEAYETGEALSRQLPGSAAGPLVLGSVYYLRGLLSASADQCRACLKCEPKSVAGRILLARVLIRQREFKEAASWLKGLAAENEGGLDTLLMLAECHLALAQHKDALDLLHRAISLHPDSEQPHLMLARLYLDRGDSDKAIAEYRRALALNPKQPLGLNNLAALLASPDAGRDHNLSEALNLATTAWRLSPDNPLIADTLGWIYALRGDFTSAVSYLSFSVRQLPRDASIRHHLAFTLAGLNRNEDAAKQLDTALTLSPALTNDKDCRILRETLQNRRPGAR